MSVAGNTTVVNDDSDDVGVDDFSGTGPSSNGKKISFAETSGMSSKHGRSISFATTAKDYFEEDHPFVVKIERDGVISALKKLNDQLVAQVCCHCLYWR